MSEVIGNAPPGAAATPPSPEAMIGHASATRRLSFSLSSAWPTGEGGSSSDIMRSSSFGSRQNIRNAWSKISRWSRRLTNTACSAQ